MKKLKILVILHPDLIPPGSVKTKKVFSEKYVAWKTEFDVIEGLKNLGHEVLILGVDDSLSGLCEVIDSVKIDLIFNLLEQFKNRSYFDYKITDFLTKKRIPFTGCQSLGLKLSRDKGKSKRLVKKCGIKTPEYAVFLKNKNITLDSFELEFPVIIKCLNEESSFGLSKESIVRNKKSLHKRISYMHENLDVDCIVEEFIEGEEVYMGFMGGEEKVILEPRRLHFSRSKRPEKEIYTSKAKWSYSYAKKQKIFTRHRTFDSLMLNRLKRDTLKICELLKISGQARIDFRITEKGDIYFLEANPNPNIARDDDFAMAAKRLFGSYERVLREIINVALEKHHNLPLDKAA